MTPKKKIIPARYIVDDPEIRFKMDYVGRGKWAIRHFDSCLTKKGTWIYEPLPSARTESFFKKTRFDFDEAMDMFKELVKGL